jgi:hypothetical protein
MAQQTQSSVQPDYRAFDDLTVSPLGHRSWVAVAVVAVCRRGTAAIVAVATLAALCHVSSQVSGKTTGGLWVVLALGVLVAAFGVVVILITRNDAQNKEETTDFADEPGNESGDSGETGKPERGIGLHSRRCDSPSPGSVPSAPDGDPKRQQATDS